jgi:hypothetical protein
VMIQLVLGWGFTYFGQRISHQAQVAQPMLGEVAQTAATD